MNYMGLTVASLTIYKGTDSFYVFTNDSVRITVWIKAVGFRKLNCLPLRDF